MDVEQLAGARSNARPSGRDLKGCLWASWPTLTLSQCSGGSAGPSKRCPIGQPLRVSRALQRKSHHEPEGIQMEASQSNFQRQPTDASVEVVVLVELRPCYVRLLTAASQDLLRGDTQGLPLPDYSAGASVCSALSSVIGYSVHVSPAGLAGHSVDRKLPGIQNTKQILGFWYLRAWSSAKSC